MGNNAVAPRQPITQQVPYMRAAVAYNTLNIGTAGKVPLGTLPGGAIVTHMIVKVVTAFNAATTNVLTVGTAASADAVLGAADINETKLSHLVNGRRDPSDAERKALARVLKRKATELFPEVAA